MGRLLLLALQVVAASAPGRAEIPPGYHAVAAAERVPADILYAVACAESGRRMVDGAFRPWPWALNVAGESRFYETRSAAFSDLTRELATHSNIDIGLGQINWHWHRRRFVSPWAALDPYVNLYAAAQVLREEFERCACNDWWIAVERYHAPSDADPIRARRERYRARVEQCWRTQ
jgi:hypothetical protein